MDEVSTMIELVFFTSSRIKLAHAVHLCKKFSVNVIGFHEKTYGANYEEPRINDREELINLSYLDALQRWNKATNSKGFFIFEDTSVIIEAFSKDYEIPGLDIKYWMQNKDFQTLDSELKALGNDRRAIVRSDLLLHLPPELRSAEEKDYLLFTSCVNGFIATKDYEFDTNVVYPWLDNKTFNKWFVPKGCKLPISMLPIVEADQYDFRAPAFKEMLEYLERHQIIHTNSQVAVQTSFDFDHRLFVICGPTCAGKTTLAEHLAEKFGYWHIEASDYMYLSYYKRHGVSENIDIGNYAQQSLNERPQIIAEQVIQALQQFEMMPAIITGFRSPDELDWFNLHYFGKYPIEVVYVDAEQEIRYLRSVNRQRDRELDSREKFLLNDKQQQNMGLAKFKSRFHSNTLINNGTLDQYFVDFGNKYKKSLSIIKLSEQLKQKIKISGELEQQILFVLAEKIAEEQYFTTTEIAHLINQDTAIKPISKNNVSRYFNKTFHPYYEIKLIDHKRKYRLSNTGKSHVRLLRQILI